MEKLNSDVKMKILMDLSSEEIIRVCQTSKDLSRACGDPRYNPLWYKQIQKDFGLKYNGPNPYEEYKNLYNFSNIPIYIVNISTEYNDLKSSAFLNFRDAVKYLRSETEELFRILYDASRYQNFLDNIVPDRVFIEDRIMISIRKLYIMNNQRESNKYSENLEAEGKIQPKRFYRATQPDFKYLGNKNYKFISDVYPDSPDNKFFDLFRNLPNRDSIVYDLMTLADIISEEIGKLRRREDIEKYIREEIPSKIYNIVKFHNLSDYKKDISDYIDEQLIYILEDNEFMNP